MAKRDLTVRIDAGNFDRRLRHLYNEASRDRDRYRAALEEIADGSERHNPGAVIKIAKRALGHRASPRKDET